MVICKLRRYIPVFEDKTYKNLMAKCMSYAPEDIDTSEGSVMYDVAGPLCMLLAENFADLSLLNEQMKIPTMTGEYLRSKAEEYNVKINSATPWIYKFVYEGADVYVGDRFFADGYYYIINGIDDNDNSLYIECETVGTAVPKLAKGTAVIPVYPIQGLKLSEVGDVFRYPKDADTDEQIRSNLQKALAQPSENANVAQVKKWVEEFEYKDGAKPIQSAIVYACATYDKKTGLLSKDIPNNVLIFLNVDENYNNDDVVNDIQEYIDPDRLGYGEGKGVIGTIYNVYSLVTIDISISAKLYVQSSIFSNVDVDEIKSVILEKLNNYFDSLVDTSSGDYIYIYIDNLKAEIQDIDGIDNCENLLLCGGSKNIKVAIFKRPHISSNSAISINVVTQEVNPDDIEEYTAE